MTKPAPFDRDALLAYLDGLGILHTTVEHPPIFTVEEGAPLKAAIPGGHSKNLFLKDKKGGLWLICALGDTRIDLNAAAKTLGAARFSFGSADLLVETLGVTPGSVTVFALLNDRAQAVRLVLDAALLQPALINFHPLSNAATTTITQEGLRAFVAALGRTPLVMDFTAQRLLPFAPINPA